MLRIPMSGVSQKNDRSKSAIKKWNSLFWSCLLKIKTLKTDIESLQFFDQSYFVTSQSNAKQEELLELLKREECLWRHKAPILWAEKET